MHNQLINHLVIGLFQIIHHYKQVSVCLKINRGKKKQ
jgi:hypothetical protein